jgi:hypothetical protein
LTICIVLSFFFSKQFFLMLISEWSHWCWYATLALIVVALIAVVICAYS